MDAWGKLGAFMLLFPPLTIVGIALFVKLIGLLNDKIIGWGKCFGIGALGFGLILVLAILFG